MSNRDDLFQKFGPFLTESIAIILLDHINILRSEQGFPQITFDQLIDEIENHISHLDEYSWMKEPDFIGQQFLPDKTLETGVLPKPRSFISTIYSKLKSLNPFSRR